MYNLCLCRCDILYVIKMFSQLSVLGFTCKESLDYAVLKCSMLILLEYEI